MAQTTREDIRPWPWPVQFATLLFVLAIATFLIVLPVLVVRVLDDEYAFSSETDLWAAMIGILLGLTTMTVSGVFVFMTFRIERGARLEAQDTAAKTAKETAKETMDNEKKAVINEMNKKLKENFDNSRETMERLFSSVETDVSGLVDGMRVVKDHVVQGQQNIQHEVSTLVEGMEKVQNQVAQGQQNIQHEVSTLVNGMKDVQGQVAQGQQNIQHEVSTLVEGMKTVQVQVEQGRQHMQNEFDSAWRKIENANAAIDDADETPNGDSTEGSSEK